MTRVLMYKNVTQIFKRNYSGQKEIWPRQVFSAIQPTGNPHLGNYLGALRKWVDLQKSEENRVVFGIADLHSLTLPKHFGTQHRTQLFLRTQQKNEKVLEEEKTKVEIMWSLDGSIKKDPEELRENILKMVATLLACGIDTNRSILFQQSAVSQHTYLCWLLGTLTTMAKLSHLPQYKEKCLSLKDGEVGIFLYPVLQTADIMLYRTTHVPVGKDQVQHIQLAQHLIGIFNNRFGSTFPRPNPLIDESCGKIMSLQHPAKKMSKSDLKKDGAVNLLDEPDQILKKIKRAVTDFKGQVTFEPDVRLGVSNLVLIHSAITGKTPEEIVEESVNLDTGKYKLVLAEVVIEHLKPIRKKIIDYLNSKDFLVSELEKGAERAGGIAEKTMKEIREKMGLDTSFVKINKKKKASQQRNI